MNGSAQICLVIPPSVFLLDERVFMSLGLLKIAAVLEQRNIKVDVLDLSGIKNYEEVARCYANDSGTALFGITATTPQMPAATNIVNSLKNVNSGIKVILGGPHITLVNAAYKKELKSQIKGRATNAMESLLGLYDTLVAGDGEESILFAMQNNCPKLIDADDPRSPLFLSSEKLTQTPFPARHLVDVQSYKYFIDGKRALSLIAQLGCPFECGFCGGRSSPMLRRIRTRSAESIVQEMTQIHKSYGINGFMLYDDELNVNPQIITLMKMIRDTQDKLGTEWRLRGFIKSELFSEEQAKVMYEAGFRWILVGFESGSPRILQNINKKAKLEENTRCLEIAKKYGLKVKALMSIGHPGESDQTIMETHDWLIKTKPDDFDVTIITTYPGSPYYDEAVKDESSPNLYVYTFKKNGDKLYSHEVDYTKTANYYKGNPDGGYISYVYTDYIDSENLVKLRDYVERDVRSKLEIPFNPSAASMLYEHSMGQRLPGYILKSTEST